MAKPKNTIESILGKWEYKKTNYLIFLAAVTDIILAYFIMAAGETNSFQSLTLAPIMLVIGYLILVPIAILYRPGLFGKSGTDT
ncbi:MAG: hypothetical protein IIA59_06685 [Candidatus Marinimicrobia bacterium]|nr:hypothetical protein [Candidatus Neomarinimicrobiota bacterium]